MYNLKLRHRFHYKGFKIAILIKIPKNIKEIKKTTFSDEEAVLYEKFILELKKYAKNNSTCDLAGRVIVAYSEANQDKTSYLGATYIVFDYDHLYAVDGDFAVHIPDEELKEINENFILNGLV